ncbi:uncharacterized protein LOC128298775 [Anopheles moucheti]|uniref:uncharacterized protein LOC128298775 n=1 Tax=Anopheles moucheti TaxID=186751 RepID=UPI0022F030CB|nr:uncharacterized protein LOC128298775 [Anopheles moucheti]
MNIIVLVTVAICLSGSSLDGAPTPCDLQNAEDTVCEQTEYEAYRDCIEAAKVHREKRQAYPCLPRIIKPIIQTAQPFEVLVPVKPVRILPVEPTRKPMLKDMDRTVIIAPDSNQIDDETEDYENVVHYRVPVNVTTVIRLTNVVNNTNHIHVPTTLNNTNVNNIHLYTNLTDGIPDDGIEPNRTDSSNDPCCTAVRPKSCYSSSHGIRCMHHKFQTCGTQCTAKVIHIQRRKRCNRSTDECKVKIAYVPQPEKPTCVYVDDWPFVVCGKLANMSVICAGCYDHYGVGYEAFNGHSRMRDECRGCYDDAFDVGPRYRRGPVLRPFYYHKAPCFVTGDCADSYENCAPGCYGHDQIDPAWGKGDMQSFDPAFDSSNVVYTDPDDFRVSNEVSDDWGVPTAKCAVVTDGTTVTIKNCTQGIDNPYMAAPVSHPHYKQKIEKTKPTTSTTTTAMLITDDEMYGSFNSGDGVTNNDLFFGDDYDEE